MSEAEIADKTGLALSTVYRICSGARFRASLEKYRQTLGMLQFNNAAGGAELAAHALAALAQNPERIKELGPRGIKDLGTFSNAQFEAGRALLAPEIRAAEQAGDPEMEQARRLLKQKREAAAAATVLTERPPEVPDDPPDPQ